MNDTINRTAETVSRQMDELRGDAVEAMSSASDMARARVLEANRTVAAGVEKLTAALPSWLPTADLSTPDVAKLVKQVFDFQTKNLAASKDFALDLVEIWAGTTPAPKPAAKRSK